MPDASKHGLLNPRRRHPPSPGIIDVYGKNQTNYFLTNRYCDIIRIIMKTMFEVIKRQNGERFAKMIRGYDNGIFEVPDIDKIVEFAGRDAEPLLPYLQSLKDIRINAEKVSISPFELLEQAGYHAEYADTLEKQNSIAKYFQNGERLCTFRDDSRYQRYYIINAVRHDIDKIIREDFPSPMREDQYGTSVMSIQILKKGGFISIKNRYNHTVNNPDNTYSSNPDNIIYGLSASIQQYFNVDFSSMKISPPNGWFLAGNKLLKYNYEINNVYFGDDFYYGNGEIKRLDSGREIMLDYFIFDMKTRELKNPAELKDGFVDAFLQEIEGKKIQIENTKEGNRRLVIEGGGYAETSGGKIVSLFMPSVGRIGDNFLCKNKSAKEISLPGTRSVGWRFFDSYDSSLMSLLGDYHVIKSLLSVILHKYKIGDVSEKILAEHPDLYSVYLEHKPDFENVPREYWTPELVQKYTWENIERFDTSVENPSIIQILRYYPQLIPSYVKEKGLSLLVKRKLADIDYDLAKLGLSAGLWNLRYVPSELMDKHPDLWSVCAANFRNGAHDLPFNEYCYDEEKYASPEEQNKPVLEKLVENADDMDMLNNILFKNVSTYPGLHDMAQKKYLALMDAWAEKIRGLDENQAGEEKKRFGWAIDRLPAGFGWERDAYDFDWEIMKKAIHLDDVIKPYFYSSVAGKIAEYHADDMRVMTEILETHPELGDTIMNNIKDDTWAFIAPKQLKILLSDNCSEYTLRNVLEKIQDKYKIDELYDVVVKNNPKLAYKCFPKSMHTIDMYMNKDFHDYDGELLKDFLEGLPDEKRAAAFAKVVNNIDMLHSRHVLEFKIINMAPNDTLALHAAKKLAATGRMGHYCYERIKSENVRKDKQILDAALADWYKTDYSVTNNVIKKFINSIPADIRGKIPSEIKKDNNRKIIENLKKMPAYIAENIRKKADKIKKDMLANAKERLKHGAENRAARKIPPHDAGGRE